MEINLLTKEVRWFSLLFMKKQCEVCGKEFVLNKRASHRKYCSSTCRRKRWSLANPEKQKEKIRDWQRRHPGYLGPKRQGIVDCITNIKETTPCMDCGNTFPACCMEFDHRKTKTKEVGSLVAMSAKWDRIEEEISNCDLLCSNCHRIRTKDRGSRAWHRKTIEKDDVPKSRIANVTVERSKTCSERKQNETS